MQPLDDLFLTGQSNGKIVAEIFKCRPCPLPQLACHFRAKAVE